MTRKSGRLEFVGTAIDGIHHGAGTSGNTSLQRTQAIVTRDCEDAEVPFISGNSIKHLIRQAGVEHALEVMGVEDGALTKPVVDLLFSGGHLSKVGAAVNLSTARQLGELFPILSICGYSAGNFMCHSKISVDQVHIVCEENAFRLPEAVAEAPAAHQPAARFLGEDFGTRHEATRQPKVARLLTGDSRQLLEGRVTGQLDLATKGQQPVKASDSSQMIFDYQVIMPGTTLFGGLSYRDLDTMEIAALRAALSYACQGQVAAGLVYHFGAKSSIGLGRVALKWSGTVRGISAPPESPDGTLVPERGPDYDGAYAAHLRERRAEIIGTLTEVMS